MFSPLEAEVLTHVTEDFVTAAEIKDRLEFGGVAPAAETEKAIAWLERGGLIAPWAGGRSTVYRTTSLGELELTRHRSRAGYLSLIGGER